jgi:hypothetical protein
MRADDEGKAGEEGAGADAVDVRGICDGSRQRVGQIVMSTDMRNESLAHSNGFTYSMVANGIAFPLLGRFRSGGILLSP